MKPKPIKEDLGPKQREAVNGPNGPPLEHFICEGCKRKCFDVNLYFYGQPSTKCLWCTKFPNKKKRRFG